jgi:DNA-binding beta-propeller fold protein YncE
MSTLTGTAEAGDVDGARNMARFADPVNVVYRDGRLYVADFDNNKIRVVDVASYETTTLIAQPGFQRPFGMAFAADGTLYVSTDNDSQGAHSSMSGSICASLREHAARSSLRARSAARAASPCCPMVALPSPTMRTM